MQDEEIEMLKHSVIESIYAENAQGKEDLNLYLSKAKEVLAFSLKQLGDVDIRASVEPAGFNRQLGRESAEKCKEGSSRLATVRQQLVGIKDKYKVGLTAKSLDSEIEDVISQKVGLEEEVSNTQDRLHVLRVGYDALVKELSEFHKNIEVEAKSQELVKKARIDQELRDLEVRGKQDKQIKSAKTALVISTLLVIAYEAFVLYGAA